jgi:hypothetical protein
MAEVLTSPFDLIWLRIAARLDERSEYCHGKDDDDNSSENKEL